jgi:hypothetical protein
MLSVLLDITKMSNTDPIEKWGGVNSRDTGCIGEQAKNKQTKQQMSKTITIKNQGGCELKRHRQHW